MRKILCFLTFLIIIAICHGQSIKAAAEQQKKQESLATKYQLSLDVLLKLLESKSLMHVNDFLSNKGWFYESSEGISTVWIFPNNEFGPAKGIFIYFKITDFINAIVYVTNKQHFMRIETETKGKGYVKTKSEVSDNGDRETIYKNQKYSITFTIRNSEYGVFICNTKDIENFIQQSE
ncbi:MAG: hypothetical protein LBR36_02605 [Bacteroidales bacterium]|jgi:hypothetical protein|nr:hypothetical protein [Bacteroidales bacterium]